MIDKNKSEQSLNIFHWLLIFWAFVCVLVQLFKFYA